MTGKTEFSRRLRVDQIGDVGVEIDTEASPEERVALARRFKVASVDTLHLTAQATAIERGRIAVEGRVKARITQPCVVTLEPVTQAIDEAFALVYAPVSAPRTRGGETVVEPEGDDPPEPLVDGVADVGEAAAEQLALAIDPYPRKPGVVFEGLTVGADEGKGRRPFAKLASMKTSGKKA
ncbi:MAG: DUF177 domain-containing protein [Alphaproteobacteria bacterium]|nr:DUF177 domain-containing protein [Alphaproteobacteria bacterium]